MHGDIHVGRLTAYLISTDRDRLPGWVAYICMASEQLLERTLVEHAQRRRMLRDQRGQREGEGTARSIRRPRRKRKYQQHSSGTESSAHRHLPSRPKGPYWPN